MNSFVKLPKYHDLPKHFQPCVTGKCSTSLVHLQSKVCHDSHNACENRSDSA